MSKSRVTRAVRAAIGQDTQHGAVVPPLCLSSTFSFEGYGKKRKYDYTRSGNPTRDQLAEALADLEGGAHAVVTASGMAAVTLALQLLSPGDLLLAPHDCYGGTHRIMRSLAERGLFRVRFLGLARPESAAQVRDARAQMVWIETPSNPLLRLTDVTAIAAAAGDALVVAHTPFLSPALPATLALMAIMVLAEESRGRPHLGRTLGAGVLGGFALVSDASSATMLLPLLVFGPLWCKTANRNCGGLPRDGLYDARTG